MNIKSSNVASLKKPGFDPPKKTTITRTFDVPVLNSERMGSVPSDKYEHNWWGWGNSWTRTEHHSCYGDCDNGSVGVYRDVPEYTPSGQPRMQTITETLSEESYSQKNRSLAMAGIGVAAGVAGSAIVGAAMGLGGFQPLAAGVSAVVGGAAGFLLGYQTAKGDQVEEVWETRSIDHPKMTGYTETIRPDTYYEETNCRYDDEGNRQCDQELKVRGYWHDYSPDISWRQVGTYERPTLQHTNSIGPIGAGAMTVAGAGLVGAGIQALISVI